MENLNLIDAGAVGVLAIVIIFVLRWSFKRMDEQSKFTEKLVTDGLERYEKVSQVLDALCNSIDVVGGKQAANQERIIEMLADMSEKTGEEHRALLEQIESYKPVADLVKKLARELTSD